jgi:hypothetical protein
VRQWEEFRELSDFSCQYEKPSSRARRFSVGAQEPLDLTSELASDAISFVVDHLASQSNGLYGVQFHRLVSGTKQVRSVEIQQLK